MWDSMHGSEKQVCQFKDQLLRRVPAWITHISDPRSRLTVKLRIWATTAAKGVGACEALSCRCREKRHVHCGPSILRFLTQASLPADPFCRSLSCVVCTSETVYLCASMLLCEYGAVCFYTFSVFYESGFGTFSVFSTLSRLHWLIGYAVFHYFAYLWNFRQGENQILKEGAKNCQTCTSPSDSCIGFYIGTQAGRGGSRLDISGERTSDVVR